MKLEASGCGCLCEVVGDLDVNKVVNYPIQNGDSGLRTRFPANPLQHCRKTLLVQKFTSWVVTIVRSHIILDYSRMDHFLVFGAIYAGGKHRLEHVDTTMYLYGEIRQCTCNWQWRLLLVWLTVSRVGDIHWRLIAGDTQQLAL